jgi:hypothetical protein
MGMDARQLFDVLWFGAGFLVGAVITMCVGVLMLFCDSDT